MKNFKQIAFGLLVGAMALGFSSFTVNAKRAIGDIYVNNGNGTYSLVSGYDPSNCVSSTVQCAYRQTSGGSMSQTLPAATVQGSNFTAQGSDKGVYQP
jgi:hypothetical protein